jgi:hypothetical protein
VLANAIDLDGDNLVISNASATIGSVVITTTQRLHYTPLLGFDGTDTISFTISDNLGGTVNGEVTINIEAYEVIAVVNKSSGGAIGVWSLLILSLLVFRNKKLYVVLASSLFFLSGMTTAQTKNITIDVSIGKSKVDQSANDIRDGLPTEASLLDYDKKSTSFAVGISYQFMDDLAFQVQYVDLGDTTVSIEGNTLVPEDLHEEISEVGPLLVKGIRTGLSYSWWQTDDWYSLAKIGLFIWKSHHDSQFADQLIRNSDSATDLYLGATAGYVITEKITIELNYSRYILTRNKVDNLMLGINYHF